MEFLFLVVVVIGLYMLLKRGGKFHDEMQVLERKVVFITGEDVQRYVDWMICESIRKLPNISTYDKASAICMNLRKAAERNNNFAFLSHLDANYKDFHSGVRKEIETLLLSGQCIH